MKETLESLIAEKMKEYFLVILQRESYRCYNKRFNKKFQSRYEFDEGEEKNRDAKKQKDTQVSLATISKTPRYVQKNNSNNQIIGDKNKGVITRRKVTEEQVLLCLIFETKPKTVEEYCKDQNWMKFIKGRARSN